MKSDGTTLIQWADLAMGIFNFISGSDGLQTPPFLRLDYNTVSFRLDRHLFRE